MQVNTAKCIVVHPKVLKKLEHALKMIKKLSLEKCRKRGCDQIYRRFSYTQIYFSVKEFVHLHILL